jgi:hypothetical protein
VKVRKLIAKVLFRLHDYLVNKEPLQRLGCYALWGRKNMRKEWGEIE